MVALGCFYLCAGGMAPLALLADASCVEGPLVCAVRDVFDSAVVAVAALGLCIVLGFVIALSITVVSARRARGRRAPRPSGMRRVSAPVHSDGAWVRLVEEECGRRVVEVLGDDGWTPSTRALAQLTSAVPTRPRV
jgi:hypothetical protein